MVNSAFSQPNWEQFWQETITSFKSSKFKAKRYWLIAEAGARECLNLLKGGQGIQSIIELGGAGGCLSVILAKKLGLKSKNLVLIDKSAIGKKAWQQFSGFGHYIQDDFFTHDFGQQRFDLVLSCGLIEHWPKRSDRLKLIKRHAQLANKYVLIRVPKKGIFMNFLRYNKLAIKIFKMMDKIDGYEKLYKPQELKKEMAEAGLKIIRFKEGLASLTALAIK